MNSPFGSYLKLDVSGASHAPEMMFRLENFPAGVRIDADALAAFMERRAPGRDRYSTQRRESDEIEFRAGFANGVTTGAPIVGAIANRDMRPGDYGAERTIPRPGHADFGQWIETGRIPTGGGRNSGRLTAPVCAAGGLCQQFLAARGIEVVATLAEVGGVTGEKAMLAEIEKARKAGDSVGGCVHCRVVNFPAGHGGALFDGLESELSAALFAIPGVKGVAFGGGRGKDSASTGGRGSDFNDAFRVRDGAVVTATNRAGGILGGRATGMPIEFDVFLKPTPTVYVEQDSVDLATMKPAKLTMKGRHDPCIARRAVPVVEAATAFALADALLAEEAAHPRICLTLTGRTLAEDLAQYRSQRYFTDMVELRVDLLAPAERARAAEFPALLRKAARPGPVVPIIFTFRRKSDGGAFVGSEKTRERFFTRLASSFAFLVSCLKTSGQVMRREAGDASGDARRETRREALYFDLEEDFNCPALEKLARARGVAIIRSRHDFTPTAFRRNAATGGAVTHKGSDPLDVSKIAFLPRGLKDVAKLFDDSSSCRREICSRSCRCEICSHSRRREIWSRSCRREICSRSCRREICSRQMEERNLTIAMGPQGLASRVLASRLGAPWTYASVGGLGELGHLAPETLVRDYRFRSVTREAALYGVTGWPLKATRSPELHNAMFAAADRDALMIPFSAKTAREAIDFMNAMGMRGLAVTIPHKEAVMSLLDRIDPVARRVGAVNTVVREGTKLVGYNTDVAGFTEAIVRFVSPVGAFRRNARVAVLGAGGASKAVVFALKKLGAEVTVYGRHPSHRKSDPHFANCGLNVAQDFDLIVNATPVDPIPEYRFTGRELVYDLVYVPAETPLMARARAAGCRVENGFSMLVAQAREQQRLFFVRKQV